MFGYISRGNPSRGRSCRFIMYSIDRQSKSQRFDHERDPSVNAQKLRMQGVKRHGHLGRTASTAYRPHATLMDEDQSPVGELDVEITNKAGHSSTDNTSLNEGKLHGNKIPGAVEAPNTRPHDNGTAETTSAYAAPMCMESGDPYSVFSTGQKRAIILSGSVIGLVTYIGSTIYYPALNQAGFSQNRFAYPLKQV